VRDEVMAATKREQKPFIYGSLSKQAIYLKEPLGKAQDATPSDQSVASTSPDVNPLSGIDKTVRDKVADLRRWVGNGHSRESMGMNFLRTSLFHTLYGTI
jgi:hypothetical protein